MARNLLGFLVAVFAIIGGLNAIGSVFISPAQGKEVSEELNSQAATEFANAFIQTYFSYKRGDGFGDINSFTNLSDKRKQQNENVQQVEVKSVRTVNTQNIVGTYMRVESIIIMHTTIKKDDKETIVPAIYNVAVPILATEQGYLVMHYPSLKLYQKPQAAQPPYPKRASGDVSQRIGSQLDAFLRTYYIATDSDQLSSFIAARGNQVEPLKNTFIYEGIEEIVVYGEKPPYIAYAVVNVKDHKSDMILNVTHEFTIVQENSRYLIESMNQ